jgi:branched-chain amino acid aminotransferase
MLIQKREGAEGTEPAAPDTGARVDELICYFEGQYVPLRDAKVSIMTAAFMYGTAVFEGIRAYWNPRTETLHGLRFREHMERLRRNAGLLLMTGLPPIDELVRIATECVRRNDVQSDVYIRPAVYKSGTAVGVKLHGMPHELCMFVVPFGNYVDVEKGITMMTSTWRRNPDDSIPARGKITGGYVNMAFQKTEAELNGYDEALVLTKDGSASEASAANFFIVRDGVLITPPTTDDILEGITRTSVFEIADALGIRHEVRSIDRSEIYVADEMFLCGTGVQLAPVVELDHRPIGGGHVGPVSREVHDVYFAAVRGDDPRFQHWLTPITPG